MSNELKTKCLDFCRGFNQGEADLTGVINPICLNSHELSTISFIDGSNNFEIRSTEFEEILCSFQNGYVKKLTVLCNKLTLFGKTVEWGGRVTVSLVLVT